MMSLLHQMSVFRISVIHLAKQYKYNESSIRLSRSTAGDQSRGLFEETFFFYTWTVHDASKAERITPHYIKTFLVLGQ
jgi:hypothetical protein